MDIIERKRNDGAAELALAILKRAADDYADLSERGVTEVHTRYEGDYSKSEIKDFFESDFCGFIVKELDKCVKPTRLYELLVEKIN